VKSLYFLSLFLCFNIFCTGPVYSLDSEAQISSQEIVRLAWEASAQGDLENLVDLINQCVAIYGEMALQQQASLTNFPIRGEEVNYQELNDVATCLFIKAEALMNTGKTEAAIKLFNEIIEKYAWAQSWDPGGWFWSVTEKAQASIDVLTGKDQEVVEETATTRPRTKPQLKFKGLEKIIDYTLYGRFENTGSDTYHYTLYDRKALAKAAGEGIYPNIGSNYKNPRYKIVKLEGRLEGSHWDFINTPDLEAAYFKWASANEPWGGKTFLYRHDF